MFSQILETGTRTLDWDGLKQFFGEIIFLRNVQAYTKLIGYLKPRPNLRADQNHLVVIQWKFSAPNAYILLAYGTIDSNHAFIGKTIFDKKIRNIPQSEMNSVA